jgi:hypothetical protein
VRDKPFQKALASYLKHFSDILDQQCKWQVPISNGDLVIGMP